MNLAEMVRLDVIRPTLKRMGLSTTGNPFWSPEAEDLLLGTAAHESMGFMHRRQMGGGPALGLWQMEPATHDDIWARYLSANGRALVVNGLRSLLPSGVDPAARLLESNDIYACAMARIQYARSTPFPIPKTLEEQAWYWDRWYNRNPEKGTPEEYVRSYRAHVLGPMEEKAV